VLVAEFVEVAVIDAGPPGNEGTRRRTLGAPSTRGGRMTMPPDDPRLALQRAQDEAARKWLEAGAKGRPPWAPRGTRTDPSFGGVVVVVAVLVLVLVVATLIAFAA
jgi:hypothetical protein